MADADYDDFYGYDGHEPQAETASFAARRWQTLVGVAGALTSVALLAGLGLWAYKLAVRDVNGIPVIRALEGPARIAPENPGGELALHQGLAVNEIAAEGTAAPPAERLTLAPAALGLNGEDVPMGALAGAADASAMKGPKFVRPPMSEESLTPAAMRPIEPLPDGAAEPINLDDGTAGNTPFVAPDAIPASVPGLARSPKPLPRPTAGADGGVDVMAEAAAAAVAAALATEDVGDVDPASLAPGTPLVQIGAYPNVAEARLEWDKTVTRFAALMRGKRRVIEQAESAGQSFYRLRAEGFTNAEDARAFCAALKSENAVCVPAVVK